MRSLSQYVRYRINLGTQTMIACTGDRDRCRQAGKQAASIVLHHRRLAMEDLTSAADNTAERHGHTLQSHANAKNRNLASKMLDTCKADSCVSEWMAWSGADNHIHGPQRLKCLD